MTTFARNARIASIFSTLVLPAVVLIALSSAASPTSAQCPGQWQSGPSVGAQAYVTMPDGDLYAGGPGGVFRWTGSSWAILPGSPGANALTVFNGELVAGGSGVHQWNGSTWTPLGTGLTTVYALTVHDNSLIAGGFFGVSSGTNAARWDGTDWVPMGTWLKPSVRALAVYNGTLVAGGFLQANVITGIGGNGVGYWDGTEWHPLGGLPTVRALAIHDGALIAGCQDCSERAYRWAGTSWQPLSVPGGYARSLGSFQGDLVVGTGCDSCPNGPPYLHRLHNGTWQPLETVLPFNGKVQALAGYGDDLFVGGTINGIWRSTCPRGDLNADGLVNDADQVILIDVLLDVDVDPDHITRADLNDDDNADGRDISVFTACRTGGCP